MPIRYKPRVVGFRGERHPEGRSGKFPWKIRHLRGPLRDGLDFVGWDEGVVMEWLKQKYGGRNSQ